MSTRLFSSLLPKVLPSVPGAPQPLVIQYIRDTAIRVCETSLAWRHVEDPFVLQPGSYINLFNKPADTDVHVIFRATSNGRLLQRVVLEDAIDMFPEWAEQYNGLTPEEVWAATSPDGFNDDPYNEVQFNGGEPAPLPETAYTGGSDPRVITQLTADRYVVLPMPGGDQTYTIRMFYALKPSRTAAGMDENVLNDLEDVIVHGALQQLLVMPKVVWNDNTLAAYHAKQFLFRQAERRARANLGNARGSLTARGGGFT
jgi:hypothetical protein